jgi:hypothetical protein
MIRNKRTTYAACVGMAHALATQRMIPRLAAPVRSDDATSDFDADSHECIRLREACPCNPPWTPPR